MKKFVFSIFALTLFLFNFCALTTPVKAAGQCTGIDLSTYSEQVPVNKTLYLKATTNNDCKVYFSSSNPSVANVDSNGFVTGLSVGNCIITAKDYSGACQNECKIKVVESEPVKFSYSSPNNATLKSTITLYAITDKTSEKVKFVVNGQEIISTSKKDDADTYIWSAKIKAQNAGESEVKIFSFKNGSWQTNQSANSSIYVTSSSDSKSASLERKRISDKGINFIAECEGYVGRIYNDHYSSNAKTIGYGYVIKPSDLFYSNLTKQESYAMLVNTLNKSSYVNSVNNFLINNNIKFSQRHLDSLASFSYNVGTAWMNNDNYLKNLIFSANDTSEKTHGVVTVHDGLNLRTSPSVSGRIIKALPYKTKVKLLELTCGWYKVVTPNGTVGYCYSDFIEPRYASYNLNDINKDKFSYGINMYHHAGKQCIQGLLNRRLDEMSIFFYGDYTRHTYRHNPHNFPIPECIKNK